MAHITGTTFTLTQALERVWNLANVETAYIGGVQYVYASRNGTASSIQVYQVESDGTLTSVGSVTDTADIALQGAWGTETFSIDGTMYLAVAGQNDDGVAVFAMRDGAPYLEHIDSVFDSDSTDYDLEEARWVTAHQFGDNTFLTVGSRGSVGEISVFQVADDGTLSFASKFDSVYAGAVRRGWPSESFEVDGTHYFMLTDAVQATFSIMSIDPDTGALALVVPFASRDELGAYDSGQGSVYVHGGVPYLFVPATNMASLHVFTYQGGADVELVDSFTSLSQISGPAKTQIYEVGDRIIVGVGSLGSESGVQLFDFDPVTGTLSELQSLPATDGDPNEQLLWDVTFGPTNYYVDGKPYALIIGDNDKALNVYAIGGGDDVLDGTMQADLVEGYGGNDTITGFAGDDVLLGFDGDDTILGGQGDDQLFGGAGNDYLQAGLGNDLINGGDGDDTMLGLGDNEVMYGGAGNDIMKGGAGADLMRGNDGDDEIVGGDGHDDLGGQSGNDFMNGGAGNDVMDGNAGLDRMFGGNGNDDMDGGGGDDLLKGNDGDDTLFGGEGNDILAGQQGDDILDGGDGDDVIQGGGGQDRIIAGDGNDLLTGGSAVDTFVFDTVAGTGGGFNRITDFMDGTDLLDLIAYGFADATAALSGAVQADSDVNLTLSDGQIVWLENFLLTDLDGSDLLLS